MHVALATECRRRTRDESHDRRGTEHDNEAMVERTGDQAHNAAARRGGCLDAPEPFSRVSTRAGSRAYQRRSQCMWSLSQLCTVAI
jgi:hypothetical protein